MYKKLLLLVIVLIVSAYAFDRFRNTKNDPTARNTDDNFSETAELLDTFEEDSELLSIQIEYLLNREFEGSSIQIEQTLTASSNYNRYIASYDSDGLKQYGLLMVPTGDIPDGGFPVIIFNHGYIDPDIYTTTERYESYQDSYARNGYVVYKPDYRGHGNSEGEALGGYGNSDYIIDVLNAVSSVKKLEYVNPEKIGMWGHSMGGWITHRAMVVDNSIKAGVIWAGMVGGYDDLLAAREPYWVRQGRPEPTQDPQNPRRRWRRYLVEEYGSPEGNPMFWNSISAEAYLDRLSGPIQLHHATGDVSVPVELSEWFYESLQTVSEESGLYVYQGDDHNISENFSVAMQRSIEFFDEQIR